MHHDVRKPMIIDPESEYPLIFANPLKTSYHKCEISAPKPGSTLLESHYPTCHWHSCCIPEAKIEFCDWFQDNICNDQGEYDPMGCMYGIDEHRYVPLEYLGDPSAYADLEYPVIATWDDDIYELHCDFPHLFQRERLEFQQWRIEEEWDQEYFSECELLYTRLADVGIHHEVYLHMLGQYPRGHPMLLEGWKNVERSSELLAKQQDEVVFLQNLAKDSRCKSPLAYETSGNEAYRLQLLAMNGLKLIGEVGGN
ncbi:hypothetical protein F4821DRAFT_243339 [Hypoxylon rubiginosum]|uniref:Uncharacterized protein n=1 Tax=Hypoxylon rubiginosum TaxID=110542 RepID=A0ACC0CUQ2_9PEZI|nr:hypothetical protein F4821DRAFT_243339 [Hypoxylon rubiginosum]